MARTTATDLLNRYWDGRLPVNPAHIAKALGIRLVGEFDMNESGSIQFENDIPVIRYDMTEAPVRQRFTIAHELGHWASGHLADRATCFRDPPSHFSARSTSPIEAEANAFAAALLMPEKVLRYVIVEKKVGDVARLANLFDVSQVAMSYRLNKVGLTGSTRT